MHCYRCGDNCASCSAEIKRLQEEIADLKDLAYNRAPKIAAKEANKQIDLLKAQLAEANARADMWERNYTMSASEKEKALRVELDNAEAALRAHCELLNDANTRADRQSRRADSYARTAKACLRDIGPALVEARERAEKAEAEIERLRQELGYIANAKHRNFDDAEDFRDWAQNRARHALNISANDEALRIKKS